MLALLGFTRAKKGVEWRAFRSAPQCFMKFRSVSPSVTATPASVTEPKRFSLRVALWLLDSPRLGHNPNVKHFAGRLLKQPAREGVVAAQSRLGQLMCRECGNARDRRIGHDLLRQAARAGDRRAQLELGRIED
ncbi:hypothetical protein EDF83_5314 [Pseudomonas protegens]|nr:hypothetical protein EDF83_5314 [Pseudomonas protegens]SEK91378.1 hypothetical protein SAMN03159355_01318 [Pseudomonas sp. NFPP10]SFI50022.1 hypothetical protein SAMN03159416_01736 [Pseudomonas sp. NFPP08]SFX27683.1 hypothetical protein SAMN03159479_01318 [Pseudomonas sp. NFPP09]BCQ63993.1 hypothetical protein PBOI14_57430 [Pseudomonas sp. Boi14]BCQ70614.1 hypothetical protein PEQA60_46040 [Pseudomonas sp. Eqa60]